MRDDKARAGLAPSTGDAIAALDHAASQLRSLASNTESQIRSVARVFEDLAAHTDTILKTAGAIVGCVEKEHIGSVLPQVQNLVDATRSFIGDRLQATTGVLETVTTEVDLLQQLSQVSHGQGAIAVQIKALSVLTNIEVAHLGDMGAGFQYLANELADFSKSVVSDTQELASRAEDRKHAIEETRRVLSAELPRQREELSRIEADLGSALAVIDSNLTELSRAPNQFRACVEDVARQISGVVAAIQAHDITRQQIAHVQDALAVIASRMQNAESGDTAIETDLPEAYAGLTIQVYQLRTIKDTIASWASQIRTCMNGILTVSTSKVTGIAPAVLEQENEVSSQLNRIELLERESEAYSARIEANLGGLSNLMQLVSEQVQRSQSIRDRLRLLTFNSIIEASRLGSQANVILAIATCIKEVAADWNQITEQSARAMNEMARVVQQTSEATRVFCEAGKERLREAQAQTSAGLGTLRSAAAAASAEAQAMTAATDRMHSKIAEVGDAGDLFHACFGQIDAVLSEVEGVQRGLDDQQPDLKHRYDDASAEKIFAAFYTTQIERDVLRAALRGAPLPVAQQSFAGNSVELF